MYKKELNVKNPNYTEEYRVKSKRYNLRLINKYIKWEL